MTLRDRLQRRIVPRAIVALSTIRWPGRLAAAARRALGRRATVRLFVAFDDAQSAVALLGLAPRLAGRRVRLVVTPVVARGIPDDPAAEDKRAYAIVDAGRLLARDGLTLARRDPLRPEPAAFLAWWTASIADADARAAFATAAMRRLWTETSGTVEPGDYTALWHEHAGGRAGAPPRAADAAPALHRCEAAYRRRRLYDTPVAVVHGQWFFAHERLAQIEHRLDELGWKAAA